MHLVYRTMEKEPLPTSLPTSLIPPSKRKKIPGALPGAVAVLPVVSGFMAGSAPLKDSLRSTPPLNSAPLLSASTVNLSPKHSFKSSTAVCCHTRVINFYTIMIITSIIIIILGKSKIMTSITTHGTVMQWLALFPITPIT